MTAAKAYRQVSWFDAQPRSVEGIAPPSDADAEQRVKVAMLVVPGFIDRVCPPLTAEHFYSEANRRTVESILAVHARDGEVDVIRVVEHLREMDRLGQVGGARALDTPAKLSDIEQREAVSAARAVWSCFHGRALALHCQQAQAALYHGGVEFAELVAGIEQRTYDLCRAASRANEASHVADSLKPVIAALDSDQNPTTIPSGLTTYDQAIDEMRLGEYSIVAAGTGIGKTSFALGVMVAAAKRKHGGLYVSTEMKQQQLLHRMLSAEAQQPVRLLRRPKDMTAEHRVRFKAAGDRLRKLPIHIDAEPLDRGKTIASIRAQARRLVGLMERAGTPLRLIVVDYIQDLQLPTGRNTSEWQLLRDASTALNALAVELNVHVMALSQLTISDKAPKDYLPNLGDLAGSKAISRPASVVTILVRDPLDKPTKEDPRTIAKMLVRKMRNGGQCTRTILFEGPTCSFADGDRDMQEGRDDV